MRPIHPLPHERICVNCRYYHQHYGFYDGWYHAIDWGHCAKPRMKLRKPFNEACDHFEEATP